MPITLSTIAGSTVTSTAASVAITTTAAGDVIIAGNFLSGETDPVISVNGSAVTIISSQVSRRLVYFVPSATGSQTVTSTGGVAGAHGLIAAGWSGVNSTSPIASSVSSSGNSSVASAGLSGATNNVSVAHASFAGNQGSAAMTTGAGMVFDFKQSPSSAGQARSMAFAHKEFSSATETIAINITASTTWFMLGAVLAAAGAAGPRQQIIWMQ